MSFLPRHDGSELGSDEVNNDVMGYFSSNYESDDEDCYTAEDLKNESTMSPGTTITELKKDGRASFSSFEAPLTPPRRRSRTSTISTTSMSSAPSSLSSSFSSSNGQRRKKKKEIRRSVQFSDTDEFRDVLSLRKYTKKELKNCWYTKSDLVKRDACIELYALRIEEKKSPKEDDTYRGLEDLMKEHREKSENRRVSLVQAVLKTQMEHGREEERIEFGVVDPIFLAVTSMELSQDSKTDALEVGMTDMLDVLSYTFEAKKQRRSLPPGEKLGTIMDPFPVPDRPRRYSAPASGHLSTKESSKEMMEALALFDDIDISTPPAPSDPVVLLTPGAGKVKKRRNRTTRRSSIDSSSKHSKSKSKSKLSSISPGKNKSDTVKSIGSPNLNDIRSPVKKKARASISNIVPASSKKKESNFSPSSNAPSPHHIKLPFSSPSPSKKQTRKRLVSSPMQSPRSSVTKTAGPSSGSRTSNSRGIRINAPTPPRQDPPGLFRRISSIRLDDRYPPAVPRL